MSFIWEVEKGSVVCRYGNLASQFQIEAFMMMKNKRRKNKSTNRKIVSEWSWWRNKHMNTDRNSKLAKSSQFVTSPKID